MISLQKNQGENFLALKRLEYQIKIARKAYNEACANCEKNKNMRNPTKAANDIYWSALHIYKCEMALNGLHEENSIPPCSAIAIMKGRSI